MGNSVGITTEGLQKAPGGGNGGLQSMIGQFRGQPLMVMMNGTSILSQGEEAGFAASKFINRRTLEGKKLSQRQLGENQATTAQSEGAAGEEGQYVHRIPGLAKQLKNSQFLSRILRMVKPTATKLRQAAKHFSSDASLQYAALDAVCAELRRRRIQRKSAGSEVDDELESELDAAMAGLMEEDGPAVRAGLNVSEVAGEFTNKQLGSMQKLRDFYRDSVLNYGGITATYRSIIAKYGEKKFKKALLFLLRALGVDMAADGSSISPERLLAIVNDMFSVKTLGGIHDQTEELVTVMRDFHQQTDCQSSHQLMRGLLDLKEQGWPQAKHFFALSDKMHISGKDKVVYFLQEVKRMLRLIPEKAFDDLETRTKLQVAAQQAVDEAVIQEEETL